VGAARFLGPPAADLRPGADRERAALRADFAEEVRRQTPMQPWAALPPPRARGLHGDPAPTDISANGLVVDGVLYVRGCNTRYARSRTAARCGTGLLGDEIAGAAVALLRLAQKYGDAVLGEKLVDYLPPGSQPHPGWTVSPSRTRSTWLPASGTRGGRATEHVRRRERRRCSAGS